MLYMNDLFFMVGFSSLNNLLVSVFVIVLMMMAELIMVWP